MKHKKYVHPNINNLILQIFLKTFSPSERCFEAGWTVHQQASPEIIQINFDTWFGLVEKRFACIIYQNVSHLHSNVLFLKEWSCSSNTDDFCSSRHTRGHLWHTRPKTLGQNTGEKKHILTKVWGSNHQVGWDIYKPGFVEPWTKLGPARKKKKANLSWTKKLW